MLQRSMFAFTCLFTFAIFTISFEGRTEDGVSKDEIKIGMTCGLTGIVGPYMKAMQAGMQVALDKINEKGGINGRRIRHVALDDAYDAQKAATNAKKLIEEEKVFAIVGGSGTATSKAFMPYLAARNVPYLCPLTGGLGPETNYFNARVTYLTEAEALVTYAVKELKGKSIGVFYQDDTFGTAGRNGVAKVLAQNGLQIAGEGKYDPRTGDVAPGVVELMKSKPDIVYLQTLPMQALGFIKTAHAKGYRPIILASSIVNSLDIIKVLGKEANGIYVSQVLPLPTDTYFTLVRDYQTDMKAAGKEFNDLAAMEGYAAILLFAEALNRTGAEVTRKGFLKTMESMSEVDLGGLKMSFSEKKHFGLDRPFIIKIAEGKLETVKR